MRRISVSAARDRISEVIARVQRRERVVLTRHGRDVGALVPMEDLHHLQATEGTDEARGALAAYRSSWRRVTDSIHNRRH